MGNVYTCMIVALMIVVSLLLCVEAPIAEYEHKRHHGSDYSGRVKHLLGRFASALSAMRHRAQHASELLSQPGSPSTGLLLSRVSSLRI